MESAHYLELTEMILTSNTFSFSYEVSHGSDKQKSTLKRWSPYPCS